VIALLATALLVIAAAVVLAVSARPRAVVNRHPRTVAALAPLPGLGTTAAGHHHRSGRASARAAAVAMREIRRLVALGLPIYCGGHRGHAVAFTFDDGPGPYTDLAVRKLAAAGERATFFLVGRNVVRLPGAVRRELAVAVLGDHTFTHPELTAIAPRAVYAEIARTEGVIRGATGEAVHLFRPPYELRDRTVDAVARRLGLVEVLWNVDSQDSLGADWSQVIANVEAGLRPGAIILMHENRGQTIRALTTLLPALARRHLRSVTVPALLAADPPTASQVREGAVGCRLAPHRARRD
jgi:peptidoglycan-N-acetylglucosamine deacetylase